MMSGGTGVYDLPHGTVTFLFTDIEGSTRLWQEFAGAMPDAYRRHDAMLREAVRAEGGVVYKTIGDAFQIAFPTAIAGVIAAVKTQQDFAREPWPLPEPLRVRMALHTGAVDPDADGDYRSPVLNRLGRLLSAGYGGQILVSQATMELARDALPAGVSFLDLGNQRLRDLFRPERVYQVLGAGLQPSFPALRTLDTRPNNLPTQSTPFIGRQGDVRAILEALLHPEVRLLTLSGPGGIGKTRLSLQIAADALDMFADGVFFIRLDSIVDPALVPGTIAQNLGLREEADVPIMSMLVAYLHDKHVLIVLDNLEQVIGAATQVSELLSQCTHLKVLVTSRSRLQVSGEHEHPVLPLQLPRAWDLEDVATVSQYESVRLFVERARLVRPAFAVTAENAPSIAEICTRLDGMPLAIELAAARIRMLPPEAMLLRLTDRLSLLSGGARDLPARQQTLRGAISWSHDLLEADDQALFRRLSVFAGGATFDAIEEVVAGEGQEWELFDRLERLVDQSLVRQSDVGGEARFAMYETIREYAQAELEAHGEAGDVKRRFAEYMVGLADRFTMDIEQEDMALWLDMMDHEQENLRAVMEWSISHEPAIAYRLIPSAARYWQWGGHYHEGKSWIERVLSLPRESVPVLDAANALRSSVIFVNHPVDTDRYLPWLAEAVELSRSAGNDYWLAHAVSAYATLVLWQDDEARAIQLGDDALAIARRTGDPHLIMWMLNNRANSYSGIPEPLDEAGVYIEEMIGYFEQVPESIMTPWFQVSAGDYFRLVGDMERAEQMYLRGLNGVVRSRLMQVVPFALVGLAIVASESGQYERTVRIGGFEAAMRTQGDLGTEYDRDFMTANDDLEDALASATEILGPDAYRDAWREGAVLSIDDLVAEMNAQGVELRT